MSLSLRILVALTGMFVSMWGMILLVLGEGVVLPLAMLGVGMALVFRVDISDLDKEE